MVEMFDVGGVALDRPFRVRRLGHFGLNIVNVDECIQFFTEKLGLIVSDSGDLKMLSPGVYDDIQDARFFFLRYGTDHHAVVLASKDIAAHAEHVFGPFNPNVALSQVSWQVGSLEEVVEAVQWLKERRVSVVRSGRDMPGSNWHVYFVDPGGRMNELFWGMEQVGWDGLSKPSLLYKFGRSEQPSLPQCAEAVEVDTIRNTADMWSGYAGRATGTPQYQVDGVFLPRPFKVVALGPIKLFCEDMIAAIGFYQDLLGFTPAAAAEIRGGNCVFLRGWSDHHAIVLVPSSLRERLGLAGSDNLLSVGLRVANYRQLRNAREYFIDKGYSLVDLPKELSPGIEHCFYVRDPDGHLFQLYASMEQIGWDGRSRPEGEVVYPRDDWPETVPRRDDEFNGVQFLGPWE